MKQRADMKVSVVIPSRNGEKTIGPTIESLLKQTYKPFEIIVVNDESRDKTAEMASKYPIKLINIKHEKDSYVLPNKAGIDAAKGDLIFLADQHTRYVPEYTELVLKHFSNPKVAGVATRMVIGNTHSSIGRCRYALYESRSDEEIAKRVKSGLVAPWVFRKKVYDEVGGYDTDIIIDDIPLTKKIMDKGYEIAYEPRARWEHDFENTFMEVAKKNMRVGGYTATYYDKYPEKFSWKKYIFTFIIPLFVLPLAVFYPVLIIAYFVPYFGMAANYYIKARKRNVKYRNYLILYPLISFISSFAGNLGYTLRKLGIA